MGVVVRVWGPRATRPPPTPYPPRPDGGGHQPVGAVERLQGPAQAGQERDGCIREEDAARPAGHGPIFELHPRVTRVGFVGVGNPVAGAAAAATTTPPAARHHDAAATATAAKADDTDGAAAVAAHVRRGREPWESRQRRGRVVGDKVRRHEWGRSGGRGRGGGGGGGGGGCPFPTPSRIPWREQARGNGEEGGGTEGGRGGERRAGGGTGGDGNGRVPGDERVVGRLTVELADRTPPRGRGPRGTRRGTGERQPHVCAHPAQCGWRGWRRTGERG